MKTREELYCRIYKSPRLLRVKLVPNFQHVLKDVHVSESRKSDDREKDQHRETCGSECCIDFRIPGIPHSAVEQVETNRKEKVRRFFDLTPKQEYVAQGLEEIGGDPSKKDNVQIAPYIGNLGSFSAHTENACSLRRWIDNTTKTDLTHCRFLDSWFRRTNPEVLGNGQSMREIMYHKSTWYVEKSQTSKERFMRKGSWKDGTQMQTIKKSLSAEGWTEEKTEEYDAPLNREEVHGPIRQRFWSSWSEARLLSTRKPVNPSSATKKTKSSTTFWRSRRVRLQGPPSNWMERLSFNKFVFILAVAAEQWMEAETKLGLLAIFNLDWTVKIF